MTEHLPINNENLDDRLQAALQDGSVRALLRRVEGLEDPDKLREAITFCEQHMRADKVASIYLTDRAGRVMPLDEVENLSLGDVETVGYESEDGSLYLQVETLE